MKGSAVRVRASAPVPKPFSTPSIAAHGRHGKKNGKSSAELALQGLDGLPELLELHADLQERTREVSVDEGEGVATDPRRAAPSDVHRFDRGRRRLSLGPQTPLALGESA